MAASRALLSRVGTSIIDLIALSEETRARETLLFPGPGRRETIYGRKVMELSPRREKWKFTVLL